MNMNIKQLVLSAALITASLTTQAGVVIEYVTRNATSGKEQPLQTMWIQNGIARMEATRGQATSAAIFKDEAMYVLDNNTKSYTVMDKATMEQTAAMMNDAMAKMREQMAKMPPDQRAMMEQMMKKQGGTMGGAMTGGAPQKPVAYDAQPASGSETIDGKACKLWNVKRDGVLSQQLCVAPMSALPGADEVIALSKKMTALFEKLGQQMRDQMPNTQQSSTTLAKINGYPIMTRVYRDGVLQPDQYVVKSWKQQPIEASQFEIPAGYTKKEMPKIPR
jgi:hypothetical protein